MLIRRIAQALLSTAFIGQGIDSLLNVKPAAEAAAPTVDSLRVLPDPIRRSLPANTETFAQINAVVQIGGGLLLATGRMPRVASAVLALTVIPGNLGAHMFWNESDPGPKAEKWRAFLSDVGLLGGLIIAAADTAGKPSLGWRGRRAAARISAKVSAALPGSDDALHDSELGERIVHRLQAGAEQGRELAATAAVKSAPIAEAARKHSERLASTARVQGLKLAKTARNQGSHLADAAVARGSQFAHTARERVGDTRGRSRRRRR